MDSLETLATFFGWCAVINFGVILLAVLLWGVAHDPIARLNAKIFGVSQEEANATFFRVLQQYRLAFAVLNVVPYFALKIMA